MDKLKEILNKYQEEKGSEIRFKRIDNSDFFVCWDDVWLGYETILSKKFGFIKRLVDNDKIDRDRILKEKWQFRLFYYDLERVKNYDRLVMYLSVEDTPIEFLVSILK